MRYANYKRGQTEQNIDAFLKWDRSDRWWCVYRDQPLFYFGNNAGGGDLTASDLADWFDGAARPGVLSQADLINMVLSFYCRLQASGEFFGEWDDVTDEARPGGEAPLEPEWDNG
jgi:hypothetical protein